MNAIIKVRIKPYLIHFYEKTYYIHISIGDSAIP